MKDPKDALVEKKVYFKLRKKQISGPEIKWSFDTFAQESERVHTIFSQINPRDENPMESKISEEMYILGCKLIKSYGDGSQYYKKISRKLQEEIIKILILTARYNSALFMSLFDTTLRNIDLKEVLQTRININNCLFWIVQEPNMLNYDKDIIQVIYNTIKSIVQNLELTSVDNYPIISSYLYCQYVSLGLIMNYYENTVNITEDRNKNIHTALIFLSESLSYDSNVFINELSGENYDYFDFNNSYKNTSFTLRFIIFYFLLAAYELSLSIKFSMEEAKKIIFLKLKETMNRLNIDENTVLLSIFKVILKSAVLPSEKKELICLVEPVIYSCLSNILINKLIEVPTEEFLTKNEDLPLKNKLLKGVLKLIEISGIPLDQIINKISYQAIDLKCLNIFKCHLIQAQNKCKNIDAINEIAINPIIQLCHPTI